GRAVHGEEVAVVGLVVRVSDWAELFGSEGVDDARVEAGGGEGALGEPVVAAGALDDDQEIVEAVVVRGLTEVLNGGGAVGAVVGEALGRHEELAEAVGKYPFRIVFVAIKAGKAEVRGSDPLDAVVDVAAGLMQGC